MHTRILSFAFIGCMIWNMSWLSKVKSIDKSWLAFNSTLQIPFWMLCIIKSWESFQLWTYNLDPLKWQPTFHDHVVGCHVSSTRLLLAWTITISFWTIEHWQHWSEVRWVFFSRLNHLIYWKASSARPRPIGILVRLAISLSTRVLLQPRRAIVVSGNALSPRQNYAFDPRRSTQVC